MPTRVYYEKLKFDFKVSTTAEYPVSWYCIGYESYLSHFFFFEDLVRVPGALSLKM